VTPLPPLAAAWIEGVRGALGDVVASAYLYGSLLFDNPPGWRVDVDFHVLLDRPLDEEERAALRALHLRLDPDGLDGYYLLLDDARRTEPPRSQLQVVPTTARELFEGPVDDAWALHRAHVLAGRVLVLDGVDPRGVLPEPSWEELADALDDEADWVLTHPEHPAFGVLNACRITWSRRTRDVVRSKYDAAAWAAEALPDLRLAVEAAVRDYTGSPELGDEAILLDAWPAVVDLLDDPSSRRRGRG
jgi:hypothetical protein